MEQEQIIIPPEGGWRECTVYLVAVSWRPENPIHRALFHSGFLHEGNPAGYNQVLYLTGGEGLHHPSNISRVHYLKAIKVVAESEDFDSPLTMTTDAER